MKHPRWIPVVLVVFTMMTACRAEGGTDSQGATSQPTSKKSVTLDQQDANKQYDVFDRVLAAAVSNGKVDYAALRKQKSDLDNFVSWVKKADTALLKTSHAKLAFYTNAYNAHVLSMVRDRPKLTSVIKEKGFFDAQKVRVAGEDVTLNALEKKARDLGDPRVHFIVNCASGSCPILENKAFRESGLEARLKAATLRYLKDQTHGLSVNKAKGELHLSNIFNWYSGDFASSKKSSDVVAWIKKELGSKDGAGLENLKVVWKEYDWSLNKK